MSKNLKGSSLDKNLRDLTFKLYSLGESKSSRQGEHRTHSHNLLKTRERIINDFTSYLKDENLDDGSKLNLQFTDENIISFLENRVNSGNMCFKSQETYVRSFWSILEALRVQNVNIPIEKEKVDNYVKELKENYTPTIKTGKSFNDVDNVINKLYEKNFATGLLGEVLKITAFRHNEGRELISNYKNYIQIKANETMGVIKNLRGKGGRTYIEKFIPKSLIDKIKKFHNENMKLASKKGFTNSIQKIESGKTPHSFRYEFVKVNHQKNLETGMSFKESLKNLSLSLNHSRLEISNSYLLKS